MTETAKTIQELNEQIRQLEERVAALETQEQRRDEEQEELASDFRELFGVKEFERC